jgi:hypothetical protein
VQAKPSPPPRSAAIATPLPKRADRSSTPSVSFAPPPKPIPESSPVPLRVTRRQRGPSALRVVLILLATTLVAAAVGASLGDGSLQRLSARWLAEVRSRSVAPPARSGASPAAPAPRVSASAEHSAAPAASTPRALTVRFQDLPVGEQAPVDAGSPLPAAPRKHARGPRRH